MQFFFFHKDGQRCVVNVHGVESMDLVDEGLLVNWNNKSSYLITRDKPLERSSNYVMNSTANARNSEIVDKELCNKRCYRSYSND
jgi:hypothetical protein